jgi:hypothetical protein
MFERRELDSAADERSLSGAALGCLGGRKRSGRVLLS